MQEQYTVRVYDKRIVDRIEKLYKNCKDIYSTRNPFLVDCITRGAETIERDLFGAGKENSISGIYEEIHITVKKLDNLLKICEKSAKEGLANLSITQKLLSSNYNMLLGLSDNKPCRKDEVEKGYYDDLPDRLSEVLEEVLEHFLSNK